VPAESQRLLRRISARDRWFLAVLVGAALVGTPAAVLLAQHDPSPNTGARCVSTTRAGIMGAGTYKYCGADAIPFCRQFASGDDDLTAQCKKFGFLR
jgi:hypothetical protein